MPTGPRDNTLTQGSAPGQCDRGHQGRELRMAMLDRCHFSIPPTVTRHAVPRVVLFRVPRGGSTFAGGVLPAQASLVGGTADKLIEKLLKDQDSNLDETLRKYDVEQTKGAWLNEMCEKHFARRPRKQAARYERPPLTLSGP